MTIKIMKRVANTNDWKWTGKEASTIKEAIEQAKVVVGGRSTGAGYFDPDGGLVIVVGE